MSAVQWSRDQARIVGELAAELAAVPGVIALAVGGSRARRRAREDSDVDLGVVYAEARPFAIERLREIAARRNDAPDPVVSDFYAWGPYVNGGAWLTVGGERVDLLYRSVERLEEAIADGEAGRHSVHHGQQPPYGFWSGTLLGELAICVPLDDPDGRLAALKRRVSVYPEALRRAVVADALWGVEFGLRAFVPKYVAAGDAYGAAGCFARFAHQLVLALFALNRAWLVNDKTALAELGELPLAPAEFAPRVRSALAAVGADRASLAATAARFEDLLRESAALAGALYAPRWAVPS
jgi:predicted nucleotidyltransferase